MLTSWKGGSKTGIVYPGVMNSLSLGKGLKTG
jgi:hypothetical protein